MMADIEMDFQTHVAAAYELRREDELPKGAWIEHHHHRKLRYVVPIGELKPVRPQRRAMDLAVLLLLKTQIPEEGPFTQGQIDSLERNVLAIAKRLGLLANSLAGKKGYDPRADEDQPTHETLFAWYALARSIQQIFMQTPWPVHLLPGEFMISNIWVYMSYQLDGSRPSMHVRPASTKEALLYHAALMIAKGTVSRSCAYCGNTFLSGGQGREKEKKRGGSRFCSDKCRYSFHNEANRKLRG